MTPSELFTFPSACRCKRKETIQGISCADPVFGVKKLKSHDSFEAFCISFRLQMQASAAAGKTKTLRLQGHVFLCFVGVAGFEPAASCSQSRRDTGLRYTPKNGLALRTFLW